MPYATVLLLSPPDSSLIKGVVTTKDGSFEINDVTAGDYLLSAQTVGYTPTYSSGFTIIDQPILVLKTLQLNEKVTELGEVVIEVAKPLFEQQIDRLVVNVQSSITASSGTALEVLERSPSVMVDHYNSALRMNGKNGVQVMVNGKLSRMPMEALYQMLNSMPAANIEKIELITTPPANFDAEGDAGNINIVLKIGEGEGMNGSFFANTKKGRKFGSAFGGYINIRKSNFNIFANYSFTDMNMFSIVDLARELNQAESQLNLKSRSDRDGGADIHSFRIGIDYNITPKTIVGILSTAFRRDWSQVTDMRADFQVSPGADSLMIGRRTDKNPLEQYMVNLNLQHNFTEQQQLTIDLDYFYYNSDQPQDYSFNYFVENTTAGQDQIRIDKSTPMNIWVAKMDYSIQATDNLTIESGVKLTYSGFYNEILLENKINGGWIINSNLSEKGNMDEVIGAAYTSLSYKINETSDLKAGLRYEHTNTQLISETSEPINRNCGSLFPTLFYSKKFGANNSWQLSYNKRITRPSFSELAPFVLFLDPFTFLTGNSSLWPALTHTYKTAFTRNGLIFSLQGSRTIDAISRFQPQVDPIGNTTTYSSINVDLTDNYIASLTLPLSITPWWEIQNNLQGQLQSLQTELERGGNLDFSQYSFSFNTIHTFTLPDQFSLELSGLYNSPTISGIGKLNAFGALNFGFRKQFINNWGTLNLSFSDIFRTNLLISETVIPEQNLVDRLSLDFDTRAFTISYTKNFGSQKVKGARKRETGSAEEQKRL